MNHNKIFKFVSLIIVILFFSYLNSQKSVTEENKKETKEGFTDNIREYYYQNKRDLREKVEDFKTRGHSKINSYMRKINSP
jgi:hypothetical protein